MHISLDGFVGGPNGEMDWILVDEAMFDFGADRTREADIALYGRVTYQMMESYWPTAADQPTATRHDKEHAEWYNRVAKVILSKSLKGAEIPNTTILSDDVPGHIKNLKQGKGKNILIFGSPTAVHSLMEENLIDDYWLYVNPVVLGEGIPLFKGFRERQNLILLSTQQFESGVVCLHYETRK